MDHDVSAERTRVRSSQVHKLRSFGPLHPGTKLQTRNPQPATRNPKPQKQAFQNLGRRVQPKPRSVTLNLRPQTLN
jgi:hypothetical protein